MSAPVRQALVVIDVRLVEDTVTTLDAGLLPAPQITAHHVKTLVGIRSYPGRASAWRSREVFAP